MGRPIRIPMTRMTALAAIAAFGAAFSAVSATAATPLSVGLGQSVHIPIAGTVANVVVTNPAAADALVVDLHSVIVQGKGNGTGQILVLDAAGHVLLDSLVVVDGPQAGQVTLYRGPTPQMFSCAPRCAAVVTADGGKSAPPPAPPAS